MREREIQREKDGSDVTIVALKLAKSFALLLAKNVHLGIGDEFCAFPCQNICTSVSPPLIGAEFTLSVAKNVALFETVRVWYALHLLGFRVVLESFTLTTMAVGNTNEGFASVLSPCTLGLLGRGSLTRLALEFNRPFSKLLSGCETGQRFGC